MVLRMERQRKMRDKLHNRQRALGRTMSDLGEAEESTGLGGGCAMGFLGRA